MRNPYKERLLRLNPYLILLPLLFLYILIILIFSNINHGDEQRYISFANNLISGFYSPPAPNINLSAGPGYPIILAPLVWIKLPTIFFKLLNALFLYFSAFFFFKTLQLYGINKNKIILYTYIMFGLYYLPFRRLPLIFTDIFTILLISIFTYMFCSINKKGNVTIFNMIISSILLAYLALTKVIFGYVILASILLFIPLYLIEKSLKIKKFIIINLLALLFCTPYLVYTYSLTNKMFYWGTSGGIVLYWMSAPYENVYIWKMNSVNIEPNDEIMKHKIFFDSISNLSPLEQDYALKMEALKNIKKHPNIYFMNWLANIGRLLFSYPNFYTNQTLKTYFTIIPNMFIVVFSILLLYPTIKFKRKIPTEIIILLVFALIYFLTSSFLRASRRQFFILIPIIGLWFGFMFNNIVHIYYKHKL